MTKGLSPRVRGNQLQNTSKDDTKGSIPACAGEPVSAQSAMNALTVYPRVCGGTRLWQAWHNANKGLSPRVRGNRARAAPAPHSRRSIPACAGEPADLCDGASAKEVYPRVCGGTPRPAMRYCRAKGLSPRVRGNRPGQQGGDPHGRSIPACAGEPQRQRRPRPARRVYPRVCGGTKYEIRGAIE